MRSGYNIAQHKTELPMDLKNIGRGGGTARAGRGPWPKVIGVAIAILLVLMGIVSWYWSREPDPFWVNWETEGRPAVTGYATTETLIRAAKTLLEKPGGYMSNDIAPPSVFLDNMPNWEFGVLVQVRDLARVLRNDFSRSQTQSIADPDLEKAEPTPGPTTSGSGSPSSRSASGTSPSVSPRAWARCG